MEEDGRELRCGDHQPSQKYIKIQQDMEQPAKQPLDDRRPQASVGRGQAKLPGMR